MPGLARLDADLQPLRAQLLAADWVRRRLQDRADRYDALHFYTHNAALRSLTIMDRVPSVVSSDSTNLLNATRIHGRSATRFTPHASRAGRAVEEPVYRHARRVTPSSAWVAENLIREYHVDPHRIEVLPMGILVPEIPEPAPRSGRLRVAFVGNPFHRKGGQWLLDAHAQVWHEHADLLLITPSPVPPRRGIEVVSDLTPGDQRLWRLLESCDVFAFPSAIDQAPNAILEAMAAWLPVVALRVGAIPEMVQDGHTGFIVDPDDERGFVRAVATLLEQAALRRQMAALGRARVSAHYNMVGTADRLLQVLAAAHWEQGR